jgi:PPM family protein phosphatase
MEEDQRARAVYDAAGASDTGQVRPANEDSYAFHIEANKTAGNFVVCDGMGGAAAGELASRLAADAMLQAMSAGLPTAENMRQAAGAANSLVFSRAGLDPALEGMGTTLVALALRGWHGWLAHVGDSRCYRLRGGQLERLTEDHSLVEEQVRRGQLTPAQAAVSPLRNVITRAVGIEAQVTVDVAEIEVAAGDMYLLASDGLTREISDRRLAEILRGDGGLERICAELIAAANRAGGGDNITCLLVLGSQTMGGEQPG